MKKICVITTTRAEYGVLRPLLRHIEQDAELELCLIVTGTHLSKAYGYTVTEIENDAFPIAERVPILGEDLSRAGICDVMGRAGSLFGKVYKKQKPDIVIVVGDRYELLPICGSAMVFGIPIAHISGGEITAGAIDDAVRHCVTKMSYLHFPGCEAYRKRIIQLGEEPERVFNFGDIGIENIKRMEYLSKEELEEALGKSLKGPYASVTFHPVTLEEDTAETQTKELIAALMDCADVDFIVTMANADAGGNRINEMFFKAQKTANNIFCYASLGIQRYLSLVKHAEFVIGNSSSGIIEVPCFGIPTINIGDRQKGRIQAESIINCRPVYSEIKKSIEKARTSEFKKIARTAHSPYGDGDTSVQIINKIKEFLVEDKIDLKKKFYDIEGGWSDEII